MQLKIYLTNLGDFEALFIRTGRSWELFLKAQEEIIESVKSDPELDPFEVLRGYEVDLETHTGKSL